MPGASSFDKLLPVTKSEGHGMSQCDACSVKILRYLDGDLQESALGDFCTHLQACARCRASVEAEQALSLLFRRTRPLYSAPAALRARVDAAVGQHSSVTHTEQGGYESVSHVVEWGLLGRARRLSRVGILVPALLVVGLVLAVVPNIVRQARAANFVETAVAAHRSYVDGNLPLGLRSSSTELVTAWFADKVPFHFRLPNSQSAPDSTPVYRLTGAGLLNLQGSSAAFVTYDKQNEKISLLVESSESAVVAGGDEVRFGALTFHYRTDERFKVITWSNHGLSYALVSSVSGSARESCLVCHQNVVDHHDFKPGP
jgi:anti-sigma factor RsiW